MRVAELEALFTADISGLEQGAKRADKIYKDTDGKTATTIFDLDSTRAQKKVDEARKELEILSRMEATPEVLADIAKAEKGLARAESRLKAVDGLRAEVKVEADTSAAESEMRSLADGMGEQGEEGGKKFSASVIAALAAIPFAGAVISVGAAIGKKMVDGFQIEVRGDRLMATTGLDPSTVAQVGRAAGEAYANNWGASIEANFETSRLAIQGGLIDADSTKRESQKVIESLSGVSDILQEDVAPTARAVSTLLRTGLARNADEAFDIIVKGQQAGLNQSEDWIDTLNEYSTQFRALGLSGPEALGLLRQGLQAGARDTDTAADALKEFAIRGKELDDSGEAYKRLGLNAEDMAAAVARGGDDATQALSDVLDALAATEDPAVRSATAIELFGTKSEDMQAALNGFDLSTAVDELGAVEGAAKTAMDTLSDNTSNDIATAQRNIELAAEGIQGALAGAFGEPLEEFSGWVTENRAGIMEFLLGIANGAIDMGRGFVNGMASSTEAVGEFAANTMPMLLNGIAGAVEGLDKLMPGDQGGEEFRKFADEAIASLSTFDETTANVADAMRKNLIEDGLDPMQDKLNEVGDQLVWDAKVHDAQVRLAKEVDNVGINTDGVSTKIKNYRGELDLSTTAGKDLDAQLKSVRERILDQANASIKAGEETEDLSASLKESRDALIDQMKAMGLTEDEAADLLDQYNLFPDSISTDIEADTAQASADINSFIAYNNGRKIGIQVETTSGSGIRYGGGGTSIANAMGNIVQPMAGGGITGTPMDPVAQMVPPGTMRIVGDRLDVDELYAPLDGSPRSWRLLMEGFRRMPGAAPMADGGIAAVAGTSVAAGGVTNIYQIGDLSLSESDLPGEVVEFFTSIKRRARQKSGV